MHEDARRTTHPPASPEPRRVGWREALAREHLPRLFVMCLALWRYAANTLLAAATMPAPLGRVFSATLTGPDTGATVTMEASQ